MIKIDATKGFASDHSVPVGLPSLGEQVHSVCVINFPITGLHRLDPPVNIYGYGGPRSIHAFWVVSVLAQDNLRIEGPLGIGLKGVVVGFHEHVGAVDCPRRVIYETRGQQIFDCRMVSPRTWT